MDSRSAEFNAESNVVREDLLETAVKFLENPKVQPQPLAQKQNFLKRKGLTNEEIKVACERSGAYALHEGQTRTQIIPPQTTALQPYAYPLRGQSQVSIFDRIREVVHNVAVLGFIAYVVYKFYERYIAPFLFGRKKKTVEESIEELDKNVKSSIEELQSNLTSVKVEVDKLSQNNGFHTSQQLSELKSDVATVKGLLLNRKQFPGVSTTTPVVPPSIPAWQMASAASEPDAEHDRKSDGSGGSSEPEHCTHKSDSSLEIIYSKESDSESYHTRKSCDDGDRD